MAPLAGEITSARGLCNVHRASVLTLAISPPRMHTCIPHGDTSTENDHLNGSLRSIVGVCVVQGVMITGAKAKKLPCSWVDKVAVTMIIM